MFTDKIKKEIGTTIENYCQGITFLEFSASDLPNIIEDIEKIVKNNVSLGVVSESTYTLDNGRVINKDCSNCRNDGLQSTSPSKCTGCFQCKNFKNWEYCR